MTERVRVAGQFLDANGPARELQDSTVVRWDGWSGDYQASCRFAPRSGALPSWVRRGALYEHVDDLAGRTWGGQLAEPTRNDDGTWSLTAYGFGSLLEEYEAISGTTPTFVPNTALDAAISDGGPFVRPASLSSSAVTSLDDKLVTVGALLQADATARGKFVYVDSWGAVTYLTLPTAPIWTTVPTPGYGGTADENYVSHLYGWFVSSVDGTTGEPDGWAFVLAGTSALRAEAQAQYGRKSLMVDLTSRGYLTGTAAQATVDAMFAAYGGRMGYTSGLDLYAYNLRRLGFGPAGPLSLYGVNGAGARIQVPGSIDGRSSTTVMGSWNVPMGEVTRVHAEERAQMTPLGFEARDFTSVIVDTAKAAKTASGSGSKLHVGLQT